MTVLKLIYQDAWVSLYHGDNRDVVPCLADVDVTITDPPYGPSTHNGALTLRSRGTTGETGWERGAAPDGARVRDVARKLVDFSSITYDEFQTFIAMVGAKTRRWLVSFAERRYVEPLEQWCEAKGSPSPVIFVREGIYYKPNGAPQVSGDRPAQGWESIAILHRRKSGRMRWNGGGHHEVNIDDDFYIENKPSAARHPTQKPPRLLQRLVSRYSDPGETILDPFAGSGGVGVAAKTLRRRAILIEGNLKHCKTAAAWLRETQPMPADLIVSPTYQPMTLDIESAGRAA
jgi:hypothetical protein